MLFAYLHHIADDVRGIVQYHAKIAQRGKNWKLYAKKIYIRTLANGS